MNGVITFDPSVPLWMVVSLFVAITILFLWKEWGRKLRFRTLRIVAVFVMMLMLAAILLRPHTNISKTNVIVLLTPGYDAARVDSLVSTTGKLSIFHSPDAKPFKNSRPLISYHELNTLAKDIRFVIGEGLPLHALDLLDKKSFTFLPSQPPQGIVEVSIADSPKLNRQTTLQGMFRNISGTHTIALIGPGGKEDSVIVSKIGVTQFTLSFTPRQTGKQLYSLSVNDSLGNIKEEKVPVTVEEPAPLRVLVILSHPTFETTFLKNFIASKGNEIVLRSQLSRNNFSYEYINHAAIKFSVITRSINDEFDLVIADRQTLQNLSNSESSVLKQSIHNGLGLLSLYDVPPKGKDQNNFFPFQTSAVKGDTTTIISGSKRLTLPALPFRVRIEAPLQQLLANNSGLLAGYTLTGKGKIAFQLLQETYRLILAGDSITYGRLWSPLLERVARTNEQPASVSITSPFPYYEDEPITFRLISSEESPTLLVDSIQMPLEEDVTLDDVWYSKVWPSGPGWHTIQSGSERFKYFVSEPDAWRAWAIENQMKENRLASTGQQIAAEKSREQHRIHPLFFYGIFLFAAGFLWLAPKL